MRSHLVILLISRARALALPRRKRSRATDTHVVSSRSDSFLKKSLITILSHHLATSITEPLGATLCLAPHPGSPSGVKSAGEGRFVSTTLCQLFPPGRRGKRGVDVKLVRVESDVQVPSALPSIVQGEGEKSRLGVVPVVLVPGDVPSSETRRAESGCARRNLISPLWKRK